MSKSKINREKLFTDQSLFTKCDESRKIDFIVLHHVAFDVDGAISCWNSLGLSAHYLIDEKGKIFQLCEDNNIAYHAGVSYFSGFEGLNKNSIGIEFCNNSPFLKEFNKTQMQSGLELCKFLMERYNIAAKNVVGHTDIAYFKEDGLLNRKQDPSHLFDWKFLAENGVGVFHKVEDDFVDKILFEHGNKGAKIAEIKRKLSDLGYKVNNFSDEFDAEMAFLARVFNRHFNARAFIDDFDENDLKPAISANANKWYLSSDLKLNNLIKEK